MLDEVNSLLANYLAALLEHALGITAVWIASMLCVLAIIFKNITNIDICYIHVSVLVAIAYWITGQQGMHVAFIVKFDQQLNSRDKNSGYGSFTWGGCTS